MTIHNGIPDASRTKIAFAVSRFNEEISDLLLQGGLKCIDDHGGKSDQVDVFYISGAYELPLLAQRLTRSGKYDAIVTLGTVIRGDTPHFDYVAGEAARGIREVSQSSDIPVIFGVLTTDTREHAYDRSGGKKGNKGYDCTKTALEMVSLLDQI